MKDKPVNPGKEDDRAGPQGTQVFSRDQIAEILRESPDGDDLPARAGLILLTSHPGSRDAGAIFRLSSDRITIGRSTIASRSAGPRYATCASKSRACPPSTPEWYFPTTPGG